MTVPHVLHLDNLAIAAVAFVGAALLVAWIAAVLIASRRRGGEAAGPTPDIGYPARQILRPARQPVSRSRQGR